MGHFSFCHGDLRPLWWLIFEFDLGLHSQVSRWRRDATGMGRALIGLAINRSWTVSNPTRGKSCAFFGQVVLTYVPRSVTKQYALSPAKRRWCSAAGKVTAGLAESNGSLPPGGCGLTACTPGSAPGITLGNECGNWEAFTFLESRWTDITGQRLLSLQTQYTPVLYNLRSTWTTKLADKVLTA